jgi:ABC-type cobalamin/Fe3+-siderophores transport system ATPase subunit|tara:strand:- start:33077 stop:33862 length:786 start_codon:yes stop_codon:yes gene_type:complete
MMTNPLFNIENLSLRLGGRQIYDGFSGALPNGGLTGIVGPNGCGKSTLLRCLAGVQQPDSGRIVFQGYPLAELAAVERAQFMAYLPQNPPLVPDMSVAGLVAKGRTPWRKAFRPLSDTDHDAIESALAATGLSDMRATRLIALSGGQRQRVWLALALAQDTPVILLDEPTAFLDLQHQLSLLRLLRQLADEQGRSIVMVLHELTLAGRFCDHLLGLRDGRLVCAGPAEQAITPQTVAALYDLQADVANDPIFGKPVVFPRE